MTGSKGSNKIALLLAGLFAVALVTGLYFTSGHGKPPAGGQSSRGSSPPGVSGDCVVVNVSSSSEKAALVRQVAADYNRTAPTVAGKCVNVKVFSKASGSAESALAKGWDEATDGQFPTVWTPASSAWVTLLRQHVAERDGTNILPEKVGHVSSSPLVIGMPKPMAEALGYPGKPLGWSDLLSLANDPAGWGKYGHPEWGAFRLGKTNPTISTAGLHATIGAYFAATGVSTDLTEQGVDDPKTVAFVRGVENSVVHYGDTTLTFLSNLQRADDRGASLSYISAVTVEEKQLYDYNQGNPGADPKDLGKHPKPKIPLVAIYPKEGTPVSDSPYVVMEAKWVTDEQKKAAAGFLTFLNDPVEQKAFVAAGFRDFEGKAGQVINPANGMDPSQPKSVLRPPSPPVLEKLERSWAVNRKRARVLFVIDVSGSMRDAVPNAGASKLDLVKQAASKAVDQFAADDEVGLWVFSSDFGQGKFYEQLLDVAPIGARRQEFKSKIAGLTPLNGTALYATVRKSAEYMRQNYDAAKINAVVFLTDGQNEYPADTDVDGLVKSLQSRAEESNVRVFAIGYGADADLPTLRRIAEATRATAYDASKPTTVDAVFQSVISNF